MRARRPWKRSRRSGAWVGISIAAGVVLLSIPLIPSLRRYVRMESM